MGYVGFRDAVRLVKRPPDASMNTTPEFRHETASVGGLTRYRQLQVVVGADFSHQLQTGWNRGVDTSPLTKTGVIFVYPGKKVSDGKSKCTLV